jgi:hypothetical protein
MISNQMIMVFQATTIGQEYDSWDPHCKCQEYIETHSAHGRFFVNEGTASWRTPEIVRLQLFRACRQSYFEANEAFWSNTTFSFDHPHCFRRFMAGRTAYQWNHL